eukprot:tig00020509_g9754.t1
MLPVKALRTPAPPCAGARRPAPRPPAIAVALDALELFLRNAPLPPPPPLPAPAPAAATLKPGPTAGRPAAAAPGRQRLFKKEIVKKRRVCCSLCGCPGRNKRSHERGRKPHACFYNFYV